MVSSWGGGGAVSDLPCPLFLDSIWFSGLAQIPSLQVYLKDIAGSVPDCRNKMGHNLFAGGGSSICKKQNKNTTSVKHNKARHATRSQSSSYSRKILVWIMGYGHILLLHALLLVAFISFYKQTFICVVIWLNLAFVLISDLREGRGGVCTSSVFHKAWPSITAQ